MFQTGERKSRASNQGQHVIKTDGACLDFARVPHDLNADWTAEAPKTHFPTGNKMVMQQRPHSRNIAQGGRLEVGSKRTELQTPKPERMKKPTVIHPKRREMPKRKHGHKQESSSESCKLASIGRAWGLKLRSSVGMRSQRPVGAAALLLLRL